MNVVSNAVKYSNFGGVVEIKFYEKNKMAVFSIIDHGFGIPTSSQDKIFKRFYRAKNVVSKVPDGNGLGLYIARRIVEKHKGKLYFVSKENEGTTFFIELPKN
jgi:signal transduction histidine kinase